MSHKLTWNGHSNFTLKTGGQTILIDPFFDGNPSSALAAKDITTADYVLVTHDHRDHIGQALEICKATGATLVAVVETCRKLMDQGLPAKQVINGVGINFGGTVELGSMRATIVQAVHTSESGLPAGYILTLSDGYTLYHAGDTGLFAAMKLYGELFSIDMALLPIGGIFTMDGRQAAMACKLLRCSKVVPMHWGTFPALEQNTDAFAQAIEKLGIDTLLTRCRPGETLTLEKAPRKDCGCD